MEVVTRLCRRLFRWQYIGLALLVVTTLALHFSIINQPQDDMTDEIYYVNDARQILAGEGALRPEHPPLGQLLITSGLALFGDNAFGWRFFSVLFGAAVVTFFYLVCARLGMSRRAALLATSLLAFENLSFVQASIAMLDVFSVAFMLAAFWLYLRRSYALSGAAIALSTLAKLNGALTLPVIALHWFLTRRDRPTYFSLSMVSAPVWFLTTMPFLDAFITGYPVNPIGRTREILSVSASIVFGLREHPFYSRPWEWILRPAVMPYYWDPQYLAVISFTVGALIIPSVVYMVLLARKGNMASLFGVLWFASTYLIWIPVSLLTDRTSYIYYFYPTVGAVCLGLGIGLANLMDWGKMHATDRRGRMAIVIAWGYLALHAVFLVLLTPLFSVWVSLQM